MSCSVKAPLRASANVDGTARYSGSRASKLNPITGQVHDFADSVLSKTCHKMFCSCMNSCQENPYPSNRWSANQSPTPTLGTTFSSKKSPPLECQRIHQFSAGRLDCFTIMSEQQAHRPHRPAKEKKSKSANSGPNPKAFAFSTPGRYAKQAARAHDVRLPACKPFRRTP